MENNYKFLLKKNEYEAHEKCAFIFVIFIFAFIFPFVIPYSSDINYIYMIYFGLFYFCILAFFICNYYERFSEIFFIIGFISIPISVGLFYGVYYGYFYKQIGKVNFKPVIGRMMKYTEINYEVEAYKDTTGSFWNITFHLQTEYRSQIVIGCGCGLSDRSNYYPAYHDGIPDALSIRVSTNLRKQNFTHLIPGRLCICNNDYESECEDQFQLLEEPRLYYYAIVGDTVKALENTHCLPGTKNYVLVYKHKQGVIPLRDLFPFCLFLVPFLMLAYSVLSLCIFGKMFSGMFSYFGELLTKCIYGLLNCYFDYIEEKKKKPKIAQKSEKKANIPENNNILKDKNVLLFQIKNNEYFGKSGFVYYLGTTYIKSKIYQNIYSQALVDIDTPFKYFNLTHNESNGMKNLNILFGYHDTFKRNFSVATSIKDTPPHYFTFHFSTHKIKPTHICIANVSEDYQFENNMNSIQVYGKNSDIFSFSENSDWERILFEKKEHSFPFSCLTVFEIKEFYNCFKIGSNKVLVFSGIEFYGHVIPK